MSVGFPSPKPLLLVLALVHTIKELCGNKVFIVSFLRLPELLRNPELI